MFIDPELAPGPPSVRRAMSIEPSLMNSGESDLERGMR